MDIGAFLDRLDLYGPDFAYWPAADVAVARACLATHAEARRAHAAALELENGLETLRPAPAGAALQARIEAAARREATAAGETAPAAREAGGLLQMLARWLSIPLLPGAIAIAASAAIGFMVSTGDIGIDVTPYDDDVEAIVFGDFDAGDTL
jgi:hypothetical protein